MGEPPIEVPHGFCGFGDVRKSQLRFEFGEVLVASKGDHGKIPRPGKVPRPTEAPQSQRRHLRIGSSSGARAGSGDNTSSSGDGENSCRLLSGQLDTKNPQASNAAHKRSQSLVFMADKTILLAFFQE